MDNELRHYGILGMKWGVRRYQNEDGSLTSAGKKRYDNNGGSKRVSIKDMDNDELRKTVERKELENRFKNSQKDKLKSTKNIVDATSNLTRQVNQFQLDVKQKQSKSAKAKLDLSSMTDKDLRDAINRANLERQYSDLFADDDQSISIGKKYLSNILGAAGNVLAVGSSAIGLALAIKELREK